MSDPRDIDFSSYDLCRPGEIGRLKKEISEKVALYGADEYYEKLARAIDRLLNPGSAGDA